MPEAKFVDGFFVKEPHENAPDFVKCKISMKRQEVISWLNAQDEDWINLDVKKSRDGKLYAQVDNWKPGQRQEPQGGTPTTGDDVPFIYSV